MSTRLFVGSLAWATTDESLREAFEQVGTVVSATVKYDRETGRSRGFGFVEMATDEEAQTAIERFNQNEALDGRKLIVNEARPQEPRSDRPARNDFGGNRGGFSRDDRGPRHAQPEEAPMATEEVAGGMEEAE